MNDRERQTQVAHRLEMMERLDPEGAALIRKELAAWHERSMRQASTIKTLQRNLARAQRSLTSLTGVK